MPAARVVDTTPRETHGDEARFQPTALDRWWEREADEDAAPTTPPAAEELSDEELERLTRPDAPEAHPAPVADAAPEARVVAPGAAPVAVELEGLELYREVLDEQLDTLWDWMRAEPDRAVGFFGRTLRTSRELFAFMDAVRVRQEAGQAALYTIRGHEGTALHGFLLLDPIIPSERAAVVHLYLAQGARGQLGSVVPQLTDLASAQHPGLAFVVLTTRPEIARLYRPHGFTCTYVLRKEPTHGT